MIEKKKKTKAEWEDDFRKACDDERKLLGQQGSDEYQDAVRRQQEASQALRWMARENESG